VAFNPRSKNRASGLEALYGFLIPESNRSGGIQKPGNHDMLEMNGVVHGFLASE
jgi:hypothetical protein